MLKRKIRTVMLVGAVAVCTLAFIPGIPGIPGIRASGTPVPHHSPLLTSPPLFTTAGQSRAVHALVGDDPQSVLLNVGGSSFPMQLESPDTWAGTIEVGASATGRLVYSVTANYPDASTTSESAELLVLREVKKTVPAAATAAGRTVLSVKLGRLLGTSGGNESATEIPPSFAIDELAQRIIVLDAVHSRIVSFDMAGKVREKRKLKTKSKTASDVVVDAPNHRTIVLDQAKDTITDISGSRQTVVSDVGAGGRPFGSRLTYDTRGDTAYVRDVAQGSFVPVLARGQRTSAAEQRAGTRSGAPTSIGDLALEVSDSSVTFGLTGSDPHGYQIDFADQVLEATDAVVDGEGIIWALVGLYKADSAATMLVRLDPATGESKAAQVPTAVPGDVTRRLAGARRGVLFLTGRSQTIDLIRYETL